MPTKNFSTENVVLDQVDKKKLIVTQSNSLVLSAQKMTLQEKRLFFLVVAHINMEDKKFKIIQIPVTEIKEYFGINTKDIYATLNRVSSNILTRVVHVDKGDGCWLKFQIVSHCSYYTKRSSPIGVACLEICLHEKLHPFLLNLKKLFGSIPLRQIVSIRSENSIRLAEILFHASKGFKVKRIHFELNTLKSYLGLAPPIAKKVLYKNFNDFKKDVLEKAKIDCDEKSPLQFTYDLEKRGRKVIGLYFNMEKNKKQTTINLPPSLNKDNFPFPQPEEPKKPQITQIPEEHEQLLKRIMFIGISESRAKNDILKDQERATRSIEVAEGYLEKEDSDPKKIYSKAYSENWSKKSQHQIEKEEKRKAYKTAEERKEAKKNFENQYIKYKEESIENVRKNLSSDKLKILESQAMQVGKQKKKENTFGSVETYTRFELNSLLEKEINISTQDEWVENKMKAWEEKKNEKSSE